jgi:putative oxidoreductase
VPNTTGTLTRSRPRGSTRSAATAASAVSMSARMRSPELAYLIITVEVLSGIALILGVWTCYAALAGIPILLGAIFTVHGAAGFFFSNPKGGWEFPAFWAIALAAQALLGDGAYALRPSRQDAVIGGQLSGAHSR